MMYKTKEEMRLAIGENLKTLRMSKNFSLEELAEKLTEITPGLLGLIELGRRGIKTFCLLELCDIFGCTPNDILGYKTEQE